jgi:hypothetical protein
VVEGGQNAYIRPKRHALRHNFFSKTSEVKQLRIKYVRDQSNANSTLKTVPLIRVLCGIEEQSGRLPPWLFIVVFRVEALLFFDLFLHAREIDSEKLAKAR